MRRVGALFGIVLLLVTCPAAMARSKSKSIEVFFHYLGKQRSASILIPDRPEPMPVILLFHGSGRNGEVMIQEWKDLAVAEGIILVAPNAADPMSWNLKPDSPDFLHLAIEEAASRHPIDRSRIYMFGHSAGAEYVLILSLLDADSFAAAALHAGVLLPAFDGAFAVADRRMPIAIWSGDRDPNFPPDQVRATQRLFEQHGYDVQLHILPMHDHNYYAVSGKVNRQAWDFLKGFRLPAPAQ